MSLQGPERGVEERRSSINRVPLIPSSAANSRVFDIRTAEAGSGRRQIDRPYLLRPYGLRKQDFVRQGAITSLDSTL